MILTKKFLEKYAKATLRSRFTALRSGHITKDIRLRLYPNFSSATLQKKLRISLTLAKII